VEGDFGTDKINGKILRAEESKTHTMLVIGQRDMDANGVSIRIHGKGNQGAKPRTEAIAGILNQIKERQ
jgi:threonyl-tRNA synthetase